MVRDCCQDYLAAAIQLRYRPNPGENTGRLGELIKTAAAKGAKLVVLPECSSAAGYIYDDEKDALERAEPIPGPFSRLIVDLARELEIHVVAGLTELEDGNIYNTAILIGPTGEILGKYRKNYLVSFDKRWFNFWEGDDVFPVWDTPLGRIGIFICGDARLPEIARCLALKGAEVLCYLTLWGTWDQYLYNCPTRAIENRVWVIASDKVGNERGMVYPGESFIIDPDGNFVAKASDKEEEIIYATIEPSRARNKKLKDGTDLFESRRTDTYNLLTKPTSTLPISQKLLKSVVPSTTSVLTACIELDVKVVSKEAMIAKAVALAGDAARLYSSLILLPELWSFSVNSDPEYWAEPIPGPTSHAIAELARQEDVLIAYGAIEADRCALYKTTVLVGPHGVMGRYRAVHLSKAESNWAGEGSEYIVCETDFGYVGLMSGMDGYFFEASRSLTLMGSDVILWPSDFHFAIERDFLAVERAIENRVFLLASSKRGGDSIGGSLVVNPHGIILARGTAPGQIIKAQAQLVLSRCKEVLPKTDLILHRRPESYEVLTKSAISGRLPE